MADENTFPALIREYAEKGEIENIITLCVSMKDQRDRAERRIDVLTHMTAELNARFRNIVEPATGRKVTEPATADKGRPMPTREVAQTPTPKPKKEKEPPKHGLNTASFTF